MKTPREQLNKLFIVVDVIILCMSYFIAWYLFIELRESATLGVLNERYYFRALIYIVPLFIIIYSIVGVYNIDRANDRMEEFGKFFESTIIAVLIINSFLFAFRKNPILQNFSAVMIVAFGVINILFEFTIRNVIRAVLRSIRRKGFNQKHILLVGYSDAALKFIDRVYKNPGFGYKVFGIVDDTHKQGTEYRNIKIIDNLSNLSSIIENNNFDEIEITISLSEYDKLKDIVAVCEKSGVHTKFVPDYGTIIPTKPVSDDFDGLPVINIRAVPLQGLFNRFVKRTIDIIGSIILLILFSPIMLIIAISIKCTSKGPIIFKQERIGKHNRIFTMYKFRSMIEQDDSEEKTMWTVKDDKRVTSIGRIIRRISFDELPQFLNVLKGEMSLVGPRPERKQYVEIFKETIPRYMIKHQVRPGITGWAQINGLRGDTPIDRRITYDLWYIENWTIGLDIKILFLTLFKGFINENAY